MEDDQSDKPSSEASSSKQMPEGMRVVRKRRKRRGGSKETLFLKKREILREMHDESGAVSLKDQVARLKSAKDAKDDGKPVEERWGAQKSGERGVRWLLLRVVALLVPVLAIITGFLMVRGERGRALVDPYEDELNLDMSEEDQVFKPAGPIAWFVNHPHEAYEASLGILDKLNEGSAEDVPAGVFRQEEFATAQIAERGIGWESDFTTKDLREFNWDISKTKTTGYLLVEGVREDQSKFRSYFVRTSDGVRLDWGATTAWSEVPFEDLIANPPKKKILVRCLLSKEPHFDTLRGPASLRSWFLLRTPNSDTHVWGFAPAGSELDDKLLELFQFGRVVMERKDEVRATLKISKPEFGTKENQFEIEELMTEEWVLP